MEGQSWRHLSPLHDKAVWILYSMLHSITGSTQESNSEITINVSRMCPINAVMILCLLHFLTHTIGILNNIARLGAIMVLLQHCTLTDLSNPLQQRLQPLLVTLHVRVQESEYLCWGSLCALYSRSHQTCTLGNHVFLYKTRFH